MERRITVFCILVISLVVLPLAISAQEEEEMTVTGCFNKVDDQEGYYVLTDKDSGEETIVMGLAALEPHSSNHEVSVTGMMMTEEDGDEVLKATGIQHIAGTCTAG